MLNIVHCITDDKFISSIVNCFEFLNDRCSNHYCFVGNGSKEFKYLNNWEQVEFVNRNAFLSLLNEYECNVVILHNFRSLPEELVCEIPSNIKVVWLAWGFDIYRLIASRPFIEMDLYHKETLSLLKPSIGEWIEAQGRLLYKRIRNRSIKKAVSRVDFFSGVIPEEYELMKNLPFFHASQLDFRYSSPLGSIDMSLVDAPISVGNDILIGNSGDPSNNHSDIFKKLAYIGTGDRKVYVPLSYAGTARYRQRVRDIGREYWGDNFVAINDFLPSQEYKAMISSCGYRFFGHERQQAVGNINIALREGCKVFLSDTSILYRHYSKMGIACNSIQNCFNEKSVFSLDKNVLQKNRERIIIDTLTSKQILRLYSFINSISNS